MAASPHETPDHVDNDRPADAPGEKPNGFPAAFPPTVTIAGVIWIVYGVLFLSDLASVPPRLFHWWIDLPVAAIIVLWGAGFAYTGWRCVRGRARGTAGIAIVSIILGFVHVGAGATNAWRLSAFLILVTVGLVLVVAGVFALTGRVDYLRWREAHRP